MTPWYALRTIMRREQSVAAGIRQLGFPAWAPVVITERGKERRETRTALIPGYVFTACGPFGFSRVGRHPDALGFLRGLTPTGERRPLAMPHDDLVPLVLAELCGDLDHRIPAKPLLEDGAEVRVNAGMWRGYMGRLLHQAAGRKVVVAGSWGRLTLDPQLLEVA